MPNKQKNAKSTRIANRNHKNAAKKQVRKAAAAKREFVNKNLHIVKLVDKNPRREGTFGYKSFKLIKNGMTVEEFQSKGGRLKDMHWDIRHNHLKLVAKGSSKKAAA